MSDALTYQVPSYLFAAVNLLLLAYFNRFHSLSTRIRDLAFKSKVSQVSILRMRLRYAQAMILCGLSGVFIGVLDILALLKGNLFLGWILFSISLVAVLCSLVFAAIEISLGAKALDEELQSTRPPN